MSMYSLFHSCSVAISIWSARELILHFLSVLTRLLHDTSVPFPFSHSFKTSIVILPGLPRQSSLITSTLFPALSSRRKIPNISYLTPTCSGISRLSSSGSVGVFSLTGYEITCGNYNCYTSRKYTRALTYLLWQALQHSV